jgi:hypothetical protein
MFGGTILDFLRADETMNAWFLVMAILLSQGRLTLHGYDDMQRILIRIALGGFVLDALLLGYLGEHLWGSVVMISGCSLYICAMQTTTRRFDFGIAGAVTSRPRLSGGFRVFGDIETNNGARDMAEQRHACRGCLAERNQNRKGWNCSSHHHDAP